MNNKLRCHECKNYFLAKDDKDYQDKVLLMILGVAILCQDCFVKVINGEIE